MSTRSRIAVELKDGTVKSVYCHHDGYPKGVGQDLLNMNFSNTSEVEAFIDEGDRTSTCLSYKKWRNEDCPPFLNSSRRQFFNGDIEEYGYLFTKKGEWKFKSARSGKVTLLERYLKKIA